MLRNMQVEEKARIGNYRLLAMINGNPNRKVVDMHT
jgi:hypothetical protein